MCQSVAVYAWLYPVPVEPVTVLDEDPLLRHAPCDGSVLAGSDRPRDLDAADPFRTVARLVPPRAVVCLATAWALHTHAAVPRPVDVVGGDATPGVRTHDLALGPEDVVERCGLLLTTRVRTAYDLARLAPPGVAAQALVDLGWPRPEFDRYVAARAADPGASRAALLSAAVLRSSACGSP